ncbi:MAG: bifunctional UDP-3-O-[3-hydroxymyristoyl] N-acetylglucosamine deacetylase/3-hydroxyacyl-ACP dehydratase [Bacteroidetes bacterium]|uniref:Multifunctional fusion protein n=1 Tax=Candidatus Gallipaludibacter merdavium TaxID=2840839 RepID=A0A9D9HUT4_9BACT|nr:bifunctional UDP-3-O-[3-hydroxymyristoyl] N-acetylglucosamine deacetylase/3-hydroxyacyl-ACP dehydratase [Candidatus Gallipaludibacter merdavium]
MKQQTLANSFTLEGKGLHTGLNIRLTFLPAAENTGICIRRVDLPGQPCYEATSDLVSSTQRGTVLEKGEWKISTIEHAMAALSAADIDNCLIEVNAPEFPIMDGSARPFIQAIAEAGVVQQKEDREMFVVRKRIEYVSTDGKSKIVLLPDDHFSVDVHVDYPSPILSNQYASLEHKEDFSTEIADARTFVFVREIEPLLQANLIKGGDLQNALVIYDKPLSQEQIDHIASEMHQPTVSADKLGYLSPLKFDNEPARHKLLDVMGDLMLIGKQIQGKVIASCPGHHTNTEFAKTLRKQIKHQEVQAPVYDDSVPPIYDINQIRRLLPHRYPFLLVDKIVSISDKVIVGVKNVTTNEPFFQGHFPQEPVMPGVLLVEAMAQTAGILVLHDKEDAERYSTYFLKIDNVKFRHKVVPGDTLVFRLEFMSEVRRGLANVKGYCFVGGKITTEAEFVAQIVKNK